MTDSDNRAYARIVIGPAALTLVVLIARALLISRELYGSHWYLIVAPLVWGSVSVLGVQGLLALVGCWVTARPLRFLLWGASTLLAFLFILETYVLMVFDVRLALIDVVNYGRSAQLLLSAFVHTQELLLFSVGVGVSLLSLRLSRRWLYGMLLVSLCCVGGGLWGSRRQGVVEVSRYDSNPFALLAGFSGAKRSDMPYTEKEIAYYSAVDGTDLRQYKIPEGTPPIIVLIIEGLSSADSQKISGVYDRLKRFDKITNEGTLFTEFFANYWDSEGGLASILHGIPPFPFPGNTRLMTSSYAKAPSSIPMFERHGYHTEFLSAFRLSWTNLSEYLQQVGFDRAQGRDEEPTLRDAPRFTFDAPTDRVLYDVTLARVDDLLKGDKPFIFFSLTISSHLPYTDPLGRGDAEENVWDFVDESFADFYARLKQTGFLDKGILMVLGDHRKSGYVTGPELDRYGVSAKARTPLAVFGKGVDKGRIDRRPFQQMDLLMNISAILDGKSPLSEDIIFVERYSDFSVFKVQESGGFEVFDLHTNAQTSFKGHVSGNSLRWHDSAPPNAVDLERSIHSWRARLQNSRTQVGERCGQPLMSMGKAGSVAGARVLKFDLIPISQPLTPSTSGYRGESSIEELTDVPLEGLLSGRTGDYSLAFHTFLKIDEPGLYWFRLGSDDGSCLFINSKLLVDANESKPFSYEDRRVFLDRGIWPLELRYFQGYGDASLALRWKTPSDGEWKPIPKDALLRPATPPTASEN